MMFYIQPIFLATKVTGSIFIAPRNIRNEGSKSIFRIIMLRNSQTIYSLCNREVAIYFSVLIAYTFMNRHTFREDRYYRRLYSNVLKEQKYIMQVHRKSYLRYMAKTSRDIIAVVIEDQICDHWEYIYKYTGWNMEVRAQNLCNTQGKRKYRTRL